jgi:radical SAM superfamily enzyme YgiQ (UPF0313 family)
MELTVRKANDRFVPAGAYKELEGRLRRRSAELSEMPTAVLSCFDRSTRLMPFVIYDKYIFPAGARSIATAMYEAGFRRTRAVFELWNPQFKPSAARLDGRKLEMLLVSSMQMHASRAYATIREAWSMGADRPLIIAGGPKAVYEPYHYWPIQSKYGPVAPDVVVTGEAFVQLQLMDLLVQMRGRGESMRTAFERARREGALDAIPGLVYLAPEATLHDPVLVDTGLQRLVQYLDELPSEAVGLGLMEPPHRREGLSKHPIPDSRVRNYAVIVSMLITQGCKFNCSYCPIPALNQKSWRFRSPERLVQEFSAVYERYRIKHFYGTDDNFFNHRDSAEEILVALSRARTKEGHRLGDKIRLGTEATQFDTYKNRDLLPTARAAGLYGIWFGIEDLTASLVNKGQKPELTLELFRLMHEHRISPMAMIMFHAGQPFHSPGSLYGLANQVAFLRKAGAISMQCTSHIPAVGTREYEKTYASGKVIKSVGGFEITEAMFDGNHVTVLTEEAAWKRQLKLLGGYLAFYNPLNMIRALMNDGSKLRRRRFGYQIAGQLGTYWTALKMLPFLFRLMTGKLKLHSEAPPLQYVPVRSPANAFSRAPTATLAKPTTRVAA